MPWCCDDVVVHLCVQRSMVVPLPNHPSTTVPDSVGVSVLFGVVRLVGCGCLLVTKSDRDNDNDNTHGHE